ncbi:accessory Sec system S-layer assembly protein [Bacillus badius]|uniref:Glutamate synthase [NADPH] large chain n=1 Tax=Bacillus badius TaxID=1455 RepID=A0ABR5AUR2_BACBA|nr:accessory Sec system S-layer assembly protein [Bacillus badius]KIL78488.1 Glutamate synthase [NADPH] large chain [Bacillus badius]MED4717452.1 accessory Sec system S-layer assembly protein [Bacillus badius]
MFSFFKSKKRDSDQLKNDGRESAVASSELTGSDAAESSEEVETELSLHPSSNVPKEQMYVLRFLNNELPPLKANQLSLSGIEWEEQPQGLAVSAFVRNSVDKGIQLGDVSLLLINEKNEVKARHDFHLAELGEIPAKSSRPWTFIFPPASIDQQVELEKENWTLAFDLTSKEHRLDLAESWEEALPEGEKEKLEQIVKDLGAPGKNELNFTGLQAQVAEDGKFHVTVLIRNGYDKLINIEQLPLQVLDSERAVIAEGQFNFGSLEIKANTTKPWSFIFPKELLKKETPDLSRWSVQVKSN